MTYQHLVVLLFGTCLLTACNVDNEINCRDQSIAIYEGGDGFGGVILADVQEGDDTKGVVVTVITNHATGNAASSTTLTGILNDNCSLLTVPKQINGSGTSESEASFLITANRLVGTITTDSITTTISLRKK